MEPIPIFQTVSPRTLVNSLYRRTLGYPLERLGSANDKRPANRTDLAGNGQRRLRGLYELIWELNTKFPEATWARSTERPSVLPARC